MNSSQNSYCLSMLSPIDWFQQSPPAFPKHAQTLRCATLNLHGFLHHRANSIHDEGSLFLSRMIYDGLIDFLGVQETGVSPTSVPYISQMFCKQQVHLLLASPTPSYLTCGILTTRWWFSRHTHIWNHPTGRAMCVTFQVRKGVRLFVCSVYGMSGGSCHQNLENQTVGLLADLTAYIRSSYTPLDDILVLGDFNLPSTVSSLETWGQALEVSNVRECWLKNTGKEAFDYQSFFPLSSPASDGTCIDHIWCSAGLAVAVEYVGATSHGILTSDHAIVICDFHTAFVGGSSSVLLQHLRPANLISVFPKSKSWDSSLWENWSSSVRNMEWKSLTAQLNSISTEFKDDYHQCSDIRDGYDRIWDQLVKSLAKICPNHGPALSPSFCVPNPYCSRLWQEVGWTQQLVGYLRAFAEPSCLVPQAQQSSSVDSLAKKLTCDTTRLNLQDSKQWPMAITALHKHLASIRRTIGKQRASDKQAFIDHAIKSRTSAFLAGRSRSLFQSFKRKMSVSILARPAGLWSVTHDGQPRLLYEPQEILNSSVEVFSGQTCFAASLWGVSTPEAEQQIIRDLLSTSSSETSMAKITRKLPPGLQPYYSRPLPASSFSALMPEWTLVELKGCLRKHAHWKAPGPSGAQIAHLKQLPDEALEFVVRLYNHIQCTGIWPAAWKHGYIYPIPKSDGSSQIEKMRPISLVETFVKVFTRRMLSLLLPACSTYIHSMQYGFTPGQSSSDPLYIVRLVYEALRIHPENAVANYIDIKNAYNSVSHCGLVYTLLSSGIPIHYVRLLMDLDIGATAQVLTPVGLSPTFLLQAGVRQGEVLSPWKFLMWINPLAGWLNHQLQPDIPQLLDAPWWSEFKEVQKCTCLAFPKCHSEHQQHLIHLLLSLPAGVTLDNLSIVGLFFADDIWIIHGNRLGAQVQVWKVSTFVRGWGAQIQPLKSACSSIYPVPNHRLCFVVLTGSPSSYITLPYLSPGTAYKYLGLPICANLCDTQIHQLLHTRLSQVLSVVSKLKITANECCALYSSIVAGFFRYFLKGVGVSWTQLTGWDAMCARTLRDKFSVRRTCLSATFWLPSCWFVRPPMSLTKLACQVWIQTVHHAGNSEALLGQLFRKQLDWLAHTPGHLPRDPSTPWDRGPMQHFFVDYALAALARLSWSLDSSQHISLVQRRFPVDFPITKLITTESRRPNFRMATMCANHGIFYVSQLCDPSGQRLFSFRELGWPVGDHVLYSSIRQALVNRSDSDTLQLQEEFIVSPTTAATLAINWTYVESVQVEWSRLDLPHTPVFTRHIMTDIYKWGLYITDGSAISTLEMTHNRSGAAVLFVSPTLEVWQASISFRITTPAYLTELVALTAALQHSAGHPRFLFSDCQSALWTLWNWSPSTITKLEKSYHPVAEWILSRLQPLSAHLANHLWPLWWLKGHTERTDWLFPLQQVVDNLAGSVSLLPVHRRNMWITKKHFLLRNHQGILSGFSTQSFGHRFDELSFSEMQRKHPSKAQWTTGLTWPSSCHSWRTKWITGIVPGPVMWPFLNAREEGLSFLTRDSSSPYSISLHGCQLCSKQHIDEPVAFLSCSKAQQNLKRLHASYLSCYLKTSPLVWGSATNRWQSYTARAEFIGRTSMVQRRMCSSRARQHHQTVLSTLLVNDLCGPIKEVLESISTRPCTTTKQASVQEVESFVWQCPTTNRHYAMHQYRFLDLWQRFLVFSTPIIGSDSRQTFLSRLAETIDRETAVSSCDRTCAARWDQSWATPDTLYAILQSLGAQVEWFGSPLNYSFVFRHHFSASLKDSVWGFQYDAYLDHSTDPPCVRQWADLTFPFMSPVTRTLMPVHFSVANPPYLKDDLMQLCVYAAKACISQIPVRIWCILPVSCKAVPDLSAHIRQHGGLILAIWPAFSFSFVPLDFWLGMQVFSSNRGHTAPMPIMLAVFQNALACQYFPLTQSNILLLQTWTRHALGPKSKSTKWDTNLLMSVMPAPSQICSASSWWDDATLVQPLLDLLIPHQWWVESCCAPFDGISPWVGAWGVPPPSLYDWLLFCGLSHQQIAIFVSGWERTGIEHMSQLWLYRSMVLRSQMCASTSDSSQSPGPINSSTVVIKPDKLAFSTRKRVLDAFTYGTTPTLAHQLGNRSFQTVCVGPFHALIRAPNRWKYLFCWLHPKFNLTCPKCLQKHACMRNDGILCSGCRFSLYHVSTEPCIALHCIFCSAPHSAIWWSVALFHPVCNTCFAELSYVLPACALSSCPVPLCSEKPFASTENTQSLDGSGYCKQHLKQQPNSRQFGMLRLRFLLQTLNCHSNFVDNSYHEAMLQPLWELASLTTDGGLSNMQIPYEPWRLDTLLPKLAPLTSSESCAAWRNCGVAGVRPALSS